MIGRPELSRLAASNGIGERAQEKDYLLAWLLAARASLGPRSLVLKGGTALRRCYFPDYRYSEDLDFTADENLPAPELAGMLDDWCSWLRGETGIEAHRKASDATSTTFFVEYVGPLQAGDGRDIKIDIALDESVREGASVLSLLADYSDLERGAFALEVYSLSEIWAEKVRSLMQRAEPRDLHDLDQLLVHEPELPVRAADLFLRKARAKGLDPADLGRRLDARETVLARAWSNRLAHQVHDLPEFDGAWRRVKRSLRQAGY